MIRTLFTATLFGLLTISAASAQNVSAIQANIPFDFAVANHTMTAGNYRLAYNFRNHVLTIQGRDAHSSTVFTTAIQGGRGIAENGMGELVFDCSSGACSLARVVRGADSYAPNLQVSEPARRQQVAMTTRVVPILISEK